MEFRQCIEESTQVVQLTQEDFSDVSSRIYLRRTEESYVGECIDDADKSRERVKIDAVFTDTATNTPQEDEK